MDRDFNRKEHGSSSGSKMSDNVSNEVKKLLDREYPLPPHIISELYKKHGEDVANNILNNLEKQHRILIKKIKKIAANIVKKYSEQRTTTAEILKKINKYRIDHNLSDYQNSILQKEIMNMLTNAKGKTKIYNNMIVPISKVSRALGYTEVRHDSGLNIKENEYAQVSKIIAHHDECASLQRQIFISSLTYEDLAMQAISGKFNKDVASNHISPVFAALYLKKFGVIDMHTLQSDIGRIIKYRYEKKEIDLIPDYLLYNDLITDQNDVVCDVENVMQDLLTRYQVQTHIWEMVLKLRNGKYYTNTSQLTNLLNQCRSNLLDDAHISHNGDEGSLLRKFLSVFSLRTILVLSKPITTFSNMILQENQLSPYDARLSHLSPRDIEFYNNPTQTVMSISHLTLDIPNYVSHKDVMKKISLTNALTQHIWMNEKGFMAPVEKSVVNSREIIIIYVNRKMNYYSSDSFLINPIPFNNRPLRMPLHSSVNKYPIDVPSSITLPVSGESYDIASVVTVNSTTISGHDGKQREALIGSSAMLVSNRDPNNGMVGKKYLLYDPANAAIPIYNPNKNGYFTNNPITTLEPYFSRTMPDGSIDRSFFDRARTHGTIYIYAKSQGYDLGRSFAEQI